MRSARSAAARARRAGPGPRSGRTPCPRPPRSGRRASSRASASRYGRSLVIASNASTVKTIRAASGIPSPPGRPDSPCRPSARGSRAPAARGAAGPEISARISAPCTVCERTTTRSPLSSGRARSRIAAGTASLPMSCRIATSSSSNSTSGASPSSSPTRRQSTARRLEWSAVPVWWWRSASTSSVTACSIATRASGAEALAAGERSRRVSSWVTAISHERGVLPETPVDHASRGSPQAEDTRSGTPALAPPAAHGRYTRARLLTGCRKPDSPRMPDRSTTRRSFFGLSAGAALLCTIGGQEVRLDDPDAARKADALASQVKRPPGAAPQDQLSFPTPEPQPGGGGASTGSRRGRAAGTSPRPAATTGTTARSPASAASARSSTS